MEARVGTGHRIHLPKLGRVPEAVRPVVLASGGLLVLLLAAIVLTSDFGNDDGFYWRDLGWIVPFVVVPGTVGAVLAGVAGARPSRLVPGSIIASVLAVASWMVFWTGAPVALGAAAVSLGRAARTQEGRGRVAGTIAVVVGLISLVGVVAVYLAAIVADWNPGLPG